MWNRSSANACSGTCRMGPNGRLCRGLANRRRLGLRDRRSEDTMLRVLWRGCLDRRYRDRLAIRYLHFRFLGLGFLNNRLRTRLDPRRLRRQKSLNHSLLLLFPTLRKVPAALQFGFLRYGWQRARLNIDKRLAPVGAHAGRRILSLECVHGPGSRETPSERSVETFAEWFIVSASKLLGHFSIDNLGAGCALKFGKPRLDPGPDLARHDTGAPSRGRFRRLGRGCELGHGWVAG